MKSSASLASMFVRIAPVLMAAALASSTLACSKIKEKIIEKAAEKAAEKAIESQTGGGVDIDTNKNSVTFKGKDGAEAVVAGGPGAKLPDNFPKSVPIYKGAKITASMTSKQGTKAFSMVTLSTPDTPDAVATFYKGQFSEMKTLGEFSTGEMRTMTFQDAAEKLSVSVSIAKTEQTPETQVTLTATTDAT